MKQWLLSSLTVTLCQKEKGSTMRNLEIDFITEEDEPVVVTGRYVPGKTARLPWLTGAYDQEGNPVDLSLSDTTRAEEALADQKEFEEGEFYEP